jgi:hypothetical protein
MFVNDCLDISKYFSEFEGELTFIGAFNAEFYEVFHSLPRIRACGLDGPMTIGKFDYVHMLHCEAFGRDEVGVTAQSICKAKC